MKLSDFDFDLPSELIAQYPSSKRDRSDLLIAATPPIKGLLIDKKLSLELG